MSVETIVTKDTRTFLQVQRDVIMALTIRELLSRFGASRFGVLWLIVEPLVNVLFFAAIYGVRHHFTAGVSTVLFVMHGVLGYMLFRNAANQVMKAVVANEGLLGFRQVRPLDAMIARALVELAIGMALVLVMTGLLVWAEFTVGLGAPLEAMGSMLLLWGMGVAVGMMGAAGLAVSDSMGLLVNFLLRPLFWLSGVIYQLDSLPQAIRDVLIMNPLLHALELFRAARGISHLSSGVSWGYPVAWIVILFFFAFAMYRGTVQRMEAS